jgi:tetratricopeptide (TPR) repeat protein
MTGYVLARAAARAQVAGRDEEATRLADEAVSVATALGLGEVEIHAMTTRGSARLALQDMGGLGDLERAYHLGVERNSPEASRTALNLGVSTFLLGDIARYRELHTEGLRIGRRFGLGPMVRFAEGSLASLSYFEGDWDRAMAEADAFLAASAREPHYQDVHDRSIRAAILFARDHVAAALAEIEAAFHGASDPQSRGPALSVAARIFCELDDPRAVDTALEVIAIDFGTTSEPMSSALLALTDLPDAVREPLLAAVSRERIGGSRWMAGARAALAGRFAEAADIYGGMPFMPGEADARFRASQQLFAEGRVGQAEAQLNAATALWSAVGATRYMARAEMLRANATDGH